MNLYILRHAIAEETSASGLDQDRVLTGEGVARTRAAGRVLHPLGVELDLILSSPYARAWQTAEIIAKQAGYEKQLRPCPALACGASPALIIGELQKAARQHSNILLVGHEPDLSHLISHLLSGSPAIAVSVKKGALCKLACTKLEPGNVRLEWLLTSKHLCRMA